MSQKLLIGDRSILEALDGNEVHIRAVQTAFDAAVKDTGTSAGEL